MLIGKNEIVSAEVLSEICKALDSWHKVYIENHWEEIERGKIFMKKFLKIIVLGIGIMFLPIMSKVLI